MPLGEVSPIRAVEFERRLLELQRLADSLRQELLRLRQIQPR
jgi:hypothetical protein